MKGSETEKQDNVMEVTAESTEKKDSLKEIDLYLVNIQGLVTNNKNKCPFLHEVTTPGKDSKIIGITETWGKKHFDGRYLATFNKFNIHRADKDTSMAT